MESRDFYEVSMELGGKLREEMEMLERSWFEIGESLGGNRNGEEVRSSGRSCYGFGDFSLETELHGRSDFYL